MKMETFEPLRSTATDPAFLAYLEEKRLEVMRFYCIPAELFLRPREPITDPARLLPSPERISRS